ncbi:ATP-binding protein [Sulfurovum sp. bin170]|uniref:ATP-binding protein n=1 Tax=Sulfurovum sp. bin170 TaxID=2695268 RepID=UPI0013DFD6E1|nr:ATP-binding protein [Sulfurovum sp. bin170]NEW61067.1 ATP-binding protein [Sulfurovum sp. bin170]
MQLLEYFYDRNNNITTYHQRKFSIPDTNRILIYGAPASGKSYLTLDYITNYEQEEALYIDFADPKFQFRDMMEEDVEGFVEANEIELLVLDHYEHEYFEILPNAKKLIIISDRFYDYGETFENLELPLLDYEEFFSFQKRGTERQIFNQFLRQGTLPQLATQTAPKEQLFQTFIQSHFSLSEQKLLGVLAHFNTSSVTTHQLYTYAKERYKISKDLIYKQIKILQQRGIIKFIPDTINPTAKKLIFFDFALAKYLTLTQSFPKQFDTMVALSLLKHNVEFRAFGISGYLTEKRDLIIPAPFESEESFWKKAHSKFITYRLVEAKKIYIITVTAQYRFKIENIEFEAIPFYEWVVINDEI